MSAYDIISYFDYIYGWAYLSGPMGTKIMSFNNYTLVTRDLEAVAVFSSTTWPDLGQLSLIDGKKCVSVDSTRNS
jgi:hypothetical protein